MVERKILGWREWVAMPELGIELIKAKVDTGARTSSLHAFSVEEFSRQDQRYVRFGIHPFQKRIDVEIYCEAIVRDQRQVTDSGGHSELRYVIESTVRLGEMSWPIEITLTNRDSMGFRMLLGRTAIRGLYLVDPGASYLQSLAGKQKRKTIK
ncbi:MAG: ATP-dependent zinc protease [Gammaproteobacteria bacterium]